MGSEAGKILAQALRLPRQARAFLAEKLIESLDAEGGPAPSPAWREEVRERCRQLDEGFAELRDAEGVFARARASLG